VLRSRRPWHDIECEFPSNTHREFTHSPHVENHTGDCDTLQTYSGPVSNDVLSIPFSQAIGASDALRTGSYTKTLTFTLSTTTP
jgi:hypothetical protein